MRFNLILLFVGFLLTPFVAYPQPDSLQQIPLNTGWRFQWGDSVMFASPEYEDTHWGPIHVDRWWNEQGFPKRSGYAWYRIHFVLPSEIKNHAVVTDSVVFHLGKIDDFDQVFLNGALLGENLHTLPPGSAPGDTFATLKTSYWDLPRRYAVAVDDPRLRWDEENVIAIRVYNWGGPGGIYSGHLWVGMADLGEYLQFSNEAGNFKNQGDSLQKTIRIKNTSARYNINGRLSIRLRDNLNFQTLQQTSYSFNLIPKAAKEISFQVPRMQQSTSLIYTLIIEHSPKKFIFKEGVPYILTPPLPRAPRINPPYIYGQRPGHPFLFRIPVSGVRPLTITAQNLPEGLHLNKKNGIIQGIVHQPGTYPVKITVRNRFGQDSATLHIVIGESLALTPPMGWNSWNVWGLDVTQDRVLQAARALVSTGLANVGWQFVNVDDGWEIPGDSPQPARAKDGTILTNAKFPDMKALGDSIHALGLKFGIYSSPGPLTCGGYTGSYGYEEKDARTFAQWGIDFLKYDLCHYRDLMTDVNDVQQLIPPYLKMYRALRQNPRDVVYSICEYGNGEVWKWGAKVGGNLWRTTGDIWDTWERVTEIGFQQDRAAPYAGPGHWNDPDMLVIGRVGWGAHTRYTRLTPDEQYAHVSLWCLLSAPLLLGCDLTKLDAFTLNLITNVEVLAIDQDPAGVQGTRVWEEDSLVAYAKPLSDGAVALGVFNLSHVPRTVHFPLAKAGFNNTVHVRDVWRQVKVGTVQSILITRIPPHGVQLFKLQQ